MEYLMCEKMVLDFCEVHQLLEEKLPIKYDSYKGHINNCGFAVHVFTKQTPFVLKADDISRLFN